MAEVQNNGIDRRSVVKGAAWSVPVLAAAVATPMAAATHGGPHWDVGVSADCVGNYDLGVLGSLLGALSLPGVGSVLDVVQGLLSGVGLTPFESRGFTITAVEGVIPAGTQFTFASSAGLIDLNLLGGAIDAGVLGLVTIGSGTATLALPNGLAEDQSTSITLQGAAVDLGVTGEASLALDVINYPDNPTVESGAPDSASQNYVTVEVSLANLPGVSDIFGLGALLATVGTLTVQLCPGQTAP